MDAFALLVEKGLEDGGTRHWLDDFEGDVAGREGGVAELDGEGRGLTVVGLVNCVVR